MAEKKILDDDLRVRVNSDDLKKFTLKCEAELKKPYQVFIRELMDAYLNDKLRINTDQSTGELYNVN